MRKAYFAGGCFWCTEAIFQRLKGVLSVVAGYSGGNTDNPTYQDVIASDTHHVETVEVNYDPRIIDYKTLLSVFFSSHDPTSFDQQGADTGEQYRSVIFYQSNSEKRIAGDFIKYLSESKVYKNEIVTKIIKLSKFFKAEAYHQNYYNKDPDNYYCKTVINPKIEKLRSRYSHLIKN